jgi:hypothetical protein
MKPYRVFLTKRNFDLAFTRLLTGSNGQYKDFFRHLYSSYDLSRQANLDHLIADIRSGKYSPSTPTMVYMPKASGVLRPLALLCIEDQIVYQAMANVVATTFRREQLALADKKCFGAIYSGDTEPYFYRHWRDSYHSFNSKLLSEFKTGSKYFSEFDLVSYYELIDHDMLRSVLERRIKSPEFLDRLFQCLQTWTANQDGDLRHGIPQGPLSSAFLAECFLFGFDRLRIRDVAYLRYVDDIRLLATRAQPIRKALIQLDLTSKRYGLVPQAQKITIPRKAVNAAEIIKTLPSLFQGPPTKLISQKALYKLFISSVAYKQKKWVIVNSTTFRFSLYRLYPRRIVMRRVALIGKDYPDFAPAIAAYLKKFGTDVEVYQKTLDILGSETIYDSVGATYIDVLRIAGPIRKTATTLSILRSIRGNSVEKSINLKIALADFIGRTRGLPWILGFLRKQNDPLIITTLLERLFVGRYAIFTISSAKTLLINLCKSKDPGIARYSAAVIISLGDRRWIPSKGTNQAIEILLYGVGLKRTAPRKSSVMGVFFREKMGISVAMNWSVAFGKDIGVVEQKCLRMQQLRNGDQTARILMVDTFNDLLLQYFCPQHPMLAGPYKLATPPKKHHPDLGAWLGQNNLASVAPIAAAWFKKVHDLRPRLDLAHAIGSSGQHAGKMTKPIKRKEAETLMKGAKAAWEDLMKVWSPLL